MHGTLFTNMYDDSVSAISFLYSGFILQQPFTLQTRNSDGFTPIPNMNTISRPFQLLSRTRPIRPRPLSPIIPKRFVGIPPAFLLDDYIPRYQLLTSVDASKKRSRAYAHLRECNLCPRKCGVNRYETTGVCLIGAETAKVNVIAPHRGEEPCIQGYHGSGSVFFSGCNLRCVFCQNHVCLTSCVVCGLVGWRILTGCLSGHRTSTERIRSYAGGTCGVVYEASNDRERA